MDHRTVFFIYFKSILMTCITVALFLMGCKSSQSGGGETSVGRAGSDVPVTSPFISVWKIDEAGESITLPLREGFNYDFIVDWGDGSTSEVTSYDDVDITHSYQEAGEYVMSISGLVESWYFNGEGDKDNIIAVRDLGGVGWKNLERAFAGCQNLRTLRGGYVAEVTDMTYTFLSTRISTLDVSHWDVSNVIHMRGLFSSTVTFILDVSHWDVSNVTDMNSMFFNTRFSDLDMSRWDVSHVTDMSFMFGASESIRPDISTWDVSSVTDMSYMFEGAVSAHPDISAWDVSNVREMQGMFFRAMSFRTDLSRWNFANVTNMNTMFAGVTLPTEIYSGLLNRIYATSEQDNVLLGAGYSRYNSQAAASRQALVDRGWSISDLGEE